MNFKMFGCGEALYSHQTKNVLLPLLCFTMNQVCLLVKIYLDHLLYILYSVFIYKVDHIKTAQTLSFKIRKCCF